jgi:predicted GNAT superfamily acetyltransferase
VNAEIRELQDLGDLHALVELFGDIWGRAGEPPLNTDTLKAMAHSGSYIAGVFVGERMVGGLIGWLGGDPRRELHMHSHILGVLPGSETHGLGFELKQHQRRWCLERSVKVMEWTTDPLVRRNAYFNLTKLGAEAPEYLVNFYGEMRDDINAGEESDRLLIRWRLDSERARAAASGRAADPDVERLRKWRDDAILKVGASGEPVPGRSSARVLICQVPEDIVAMRRSEPSLARAWRRALRETLGESMHRGYVVTGATRSGWYVLESGTA